MKIKTVLSIVAILLIFTIIFTVYEVIDIHETIDNIDNEVTSLKAQIEEETAERQAANQQLQANVVTEEAARIAADAARIAADEDLRNQIDNIQIPKLGAWQSKDVNTVYYTNTDGFVVAFGYSPGTYIRVSGLTDSSNPPSTIRAVDDGRGLNHASIAMPVRKGDYWKVTGGSNVIIYWIPLGN
jgi:cell division protein FtsL